MNRYLTINEVAENLGVKARTVRDWKSRGKIPVTVLPGGDIRFNEKEIEKWLELRTVRKKKPYENKQFPSAGDVAMDAIGADPNQKVNKAEGFL